MAKKLKVAGVQFIDTAGNAYLNRPPLYAYVSGNKPPKEILNQASRVTHVFDAAGLKVIFGFLCDLELVNKSYRDIAARTDVALGTVSRVLASLKESGYLIDQGKKQGRVLVNRSRLLEKWVEAYPQKLRPKYLIGEFVGEDPYWWKNFEIEPSEALWGAEVAAAKYVDYLKPQAVTIYLFGNTENQFLANARMRKPVGDNSEKSALVTIYRAFWNKSLISSIQQPGLAHPLLVYADLISTGDSRNLETARMIYEQFINEYIRED